MQGFVTSRPSWAAAASPVRLLWAFVLLLVALDALARLTYWGRHRVADGWIGWFDASAEGSVPTLFAVATMALVGGAAWRRAADAEPRRCWRCFGALFVYLAVDDLLGLHERFGALLHPWLGGHGVYVWTFTLAPVFAVIGGVCARRLLRALDPPQRRQLIAGFVALACALLCEVAEDRAIASGRLLRGVPLVAYTSWVEEALELIGPVLLLLAIVPTRRSVRAIGTIESERAAASVRFVGAGR